MNDENRPAPRDDAVDARLPDVPATLATERLILRAPHPGDAVEVNRAVRESFERLREWMDWATHLPSLEETEAVHERARAAFAERRELSYSLFLRDGGAFVGKAAIARIDWSVPKAEIGYWLRTRYEGRGLMTEAVAALVDLAFDTLRMRRVEIRCDPRNRRSAAIAERLGFVLEGVLRNERRGPHGGLRDTAVYAIVR